jgi:hypothetical protein
MKSGIFLWFECRKTFRDIPVVDGWSAMLWKLGGSDLSDKVSEHSKSQLAQAECRSQV